MDGGLQVPIICAWGKVHPRSLSFLDLAGSLINHEQAGICWLAVYKQFWKEMCFFPDVFLMGVRICLVFASFFDTPGPLPEAPISQRNSLTSTDFLAPATGEGTHTVGLSARKSPLLPVFPGGQGAECFV